MSRELSIAGRPIGPDHPPYVIAEMSANHNGRIETAFAIIEAAKAAGVDAVKMQTYTADTITLRSDAPEFRISEGLWAGRTLHDLYDEAHTPWAWHGALFDHARRIGVTLFSSPFDATAVDLLEDLGAPAYKIASFEAVDLPLIRYVAATGKPMIISTGMADKREIFEAIGAARAAGCADLAILHCVSGYPAAPGDYDLRTIADMAERFEVVVGLSDHTLDNVTAIASVAVGAALIEKHFTLDRRGGGPDDSFSLEPQELSNLCRDARTAWTAMGRVRYERTGSELGNVQFRRSLYFVRALKAGELVTPDAIRSVRPGHGLPPKMIDRIIGRRMCRDTEAGRPVTAEAVGLGDETP